MNNNFIKFGKGAKKVLILHGWGFNTENSWKNFLELNANNLEFSFYFFFYPGLDRLPLNGINSSLGFAKYLSEQIRYANLEFDFILAHSFGCKLATILCTDFKLNVKKVVFIGAAGLKYKLTIVEAVKKILSQYFAFLKPFKFLKGLLSSKDYKDVLNTELATVFQNVIKEDLTHNFKQLKIPTLLIYGTKDTYTPLYMGRGINALIKNSKLHIIKGANHGLHIHYPEMINNLAQEFYKNN